MTAEHLNGVAERSFYILEREIPDLHIGDTSPSNFNLKRWRIYLSTQYIFTIEDSNTVAWCSNVFTPRICFMTLLPGNRRHALSRVSCKYSIQYFLHLNRPRQVYLTQRCIQISISNCYSRIIQLKTALARAKIFMVYQYQYLYFRIDSTPPPSYVSKKTTPSKMYTSKTNLDSKIYHQSLLIVLVGDFE